MKIRETLRAYWIVLLSPVLLLAPLMLRGQVLFWGTPSLQFVPWWVQAWNSLRQGALPLWNPLNGMGAPLIANYQLGFFYPPNWLLLIFAALGGEEGAAVGVAWGYTLLSVLHLAWAGLGMAVLLRHLGFRPLAQIVGGLAYGLSGYTVGRLAFFPMVWVAAWLPWVILFADRLAKPEGKDHRFMLSLGMVGALAMQLLAGHAQLAWYSILLAGLWVAFTAYRHGGLLRAFWSIISLAAAGLLAAGIAAVQLLPTAEYLMHSQRSDAFAYEEAMTYSFWPWRLLTLFAPEFFGSPASGDYWGYASYWEDHLYLGMLPLLLALATLILLFRRRNRGRFGWLITGLWALLAVTLVLALGRNTPVFPFLYRYIPSFDMFQAPARTLIWAAIALPILAAVGVEHWRSPTGRGLYWFRLGTAGAFAVTLGAGLASYFLTDVRLTFIRATALAGLWALGFGLLTLVIPYAARRGKLHWWQGAVIAWALADLLITGWTLNPGVRSDFYAGRSAGAARVQAVAEGSRVFLPRLYEFDLKFRRVFRFGDFNPLEDWSAARETLLPNLNLVDGIPAVNNFDPLVPDHYARWMAGIEAMHPDVQAGWLSHMGVGAVERIDGSEPNGVRFDRIEPLPRWQWYACAYGAQNAADAWRMLEMDWQRAPMPDRYLIVERIPAENQEIFVSTCDPNVDPRSITLVLQNPGWVTLRVEGGQQGGWLFLADTWYPGWRATIDGVETPIYRADGMFRAVWIPAESGIVEFIYWPTVGFSAGAFLSILVLLCVLFLKYQRGRRISFKSS